MKFKEITLYTNQLENEINFYNKTLGFPIQHQNEQEFSVQIGWSKLTFKLSTEPHFYHYCFLIPKNQLLEAKAWMEERLDLLSDEHAQTIQLFESWNAEAFYFFDGSGNIAELIVRHDLEYENSEPFNYDSFICMNELGMPTTRIKEFNQKLENEMNSFFWKGNFERFCTNGTQEALFIIPNYKLKETWFPTDLKIKTDPFSAIIENDSKLFKVEYKEEQLKIEQYEMAFS